MIKIHETLNFYNFFSNQQDLESPKGKKPDVYNEIKNILIENYQPNSNMTVERLKFRAAHPSLGDNYKTYIDKLRDKSKYCGFDTGYR